MGPCTGFRADGAKGGRVGALKGPGLKGPCTGFTGARDQGAPYRGFRGARF